MAGRIRQIGAVLVSLLAASGAANAQSIVDAKGKIVGQYAPGRIEGTEIAIRRLNSSVAVAFNISKNGLAKNWAFYGYFYQSVDCTGIPYLVYTPRNQLVEPASFLPEQIGDDASTKGKLVYPGASSTNLIMASHSDPSSEASNCEAFTPETMPARPAIELDISNWRLTAPLKIR